jgi:hypothetical protein
VNVRPVAGNRTAVTFLIAYVAMYVLATWCAVQITAEPLQPGLDCILPYKTRLIVAMSIAVVASAVLAMMSAGVRVMSYGGFGRDVMTPKIFFSAGWMSVLFANAPAVLIAFSWAMTRRGAHQWVQAIGIPRFNIVMLFLVPTLAYGAGVVAVILVESIVTAQRS